MSLRRRDDGSEALLEAATTAVRDRDSFGRIQPSPAWVDLTPEQCDELYDRQWLARSIERALDRDGLSTSARAVTERARLLPQFRDD